MLLAHFEVCGVPCSSDKVFKFPPRLRAFRGHIGETECELFCGYDETDRVHEVLDSAK